MSLQKKFSNLLGFFKPSDKSHIENPKGSLHSPHPMEDVMDHPTDTDNTDGHSLYVLVVSLCATVISFPVVWVLATSSSYGLVA